MLLEECKSVFAWKEGVAFDQQTPECQQCLRSFLASVQLLEAWAKSPDGINQRPAMQHAALGTTVDEIGSVDEMLTAVGYESWKAWLSLGTGEWLNWVNDEFELTSDGTELH
jgi:hypothetical protein